MEIQKGVTGPVHVTPSQCKYGSTIQGSRFIFLFFLKTPCHPMQGEGIWIKSAVDPKDDRITAVKYFNSWHAGHKNRKDKI